MANGSGLYVYWVGLIKESTWVWADGTSLNYGRWWSRDKSSPHWDSNYGSLTPQRHGIHFASVKYTSSRTISQNNGSLLPCVVCLFSRDTASLST